MKKNASLGPYKSINSLRIVVMHAYLKPTTIKCRRWGSGKR